MCYATQEVEFSFYQQNEHMQLREYTNPEEGGTVENKLILQIRTLLGLGLCVLFSVSIVKWCVLFVCTVAVHEPIPVGQFAAYVEQLHVNENCLFGEQYRVYSTVSL